MAIRPETYGANGTDSAVDTSALQSALNAAQYDVVTLTQGATYLVDDELDVPAGVTLMGNGATIRVKANSAITGAVFRIAGNDVRISGVKIDAAADSTGANNGITCTGRERIQITGCVISNTAAAGIAIEESSQVLLEANTIDTCGRALTVTSGTSTNNHGIMIFTAGSGNTRYVTVRDNLVRSAYRKGITTYTGSTGTVSNINLIGNRIESCGLGGIYIASSPSAARQSEIMIHNNVLSDNYVNIEVVSVDKSTVTDNVSNGGDFVGVQIYDTNLSYVSGNIVDKAGVHGIIALSPSGNNEYLTIANNIVKDVNESIAGFGAGIWLQNTVQSIVSTNIVIDDSGNMTHGIYQDGTSANNLVTDNKLVGI